MAGSTEEHLDPEVAEVEDGAMGNEATQPEAESQVTDAEEGTSTDSDKGAQAELEELRDRHLRLAAEFENFRKRTREELMGAGERAQATLVGSLLDVLDDFHRMHEVEVEHATAGSVLEGVSLVQRKLDRVLAEAGA